MSFKDFIKTEMPEFVWNWHHDIICKEIDRLLFSEERGTPNNLMILAPPRSSKTTLCSIMLPGYTFSLKDIGIFSSSTVIAQYRKRDFMRKFGKHDNVQFFGVDTPITGRAIDYGIIDLPFESPSFNSIEIGNKTWDWYCSTYHARKSINAKTILVCSNTEYSLANYILSRDKNAWTVIRIPALLSPIVSTNTSLERSYWEQRHPTNQLIEYRKLCRDSWKYIYQQETKDIPYQNA